MECNRCGKSGCFLCMFWNEKLHIKNHPSVARIDGKHYIIGDSHSEPRGFSGNLHVIVFNDGRIVRTTNLWFQGEIPDCYKADLPDNASFGEPTSVRDMMIVAIQGCPELSLNWKFAKQELGKDTWKYPNFSAWLASLSDEALTEEYNDITAIFQALEKKDGR